MKPAKPTKRVKPVKLIESAKPVKPVKPAKPSEPAKPALTRLIMESAHRANILPLTSACNVRCVFCSHRQNPPGIDIYQLPPRTPEEIRATLEFIDPAKKIVIGESVTRIIEGEPFTHPQIQTILTLIREQLPATTVQLTTNGTMLDQPVAELLARLAPVEINLSLNSRCTGTRARLMADRQAEKAVAAAQLLREYRIPYHGSIVAMPHLTGWVDLEETILYLAGQQARTIRIFLPGHTRLAPAELQAAPGLWAELTAFVMEMRQKTDVPLTVEPQQLNDLRAVVAGVMPGSPAHRAGIKPGDVIIKVRGKTVYSRVDAFEKIRRAGGSIPLELKKGGEAFFAAIEKQSREASGLVMDYDLHPGLPAEIGRLVNSRRWSQVLLFTSRLAEGVIRSVRPGIATDAGIAIHPAASRYFGGNIMSAGLLTVEDFAAAWDEWTKGRRSRPDAILLPAVAFDARGRDLTGRSYHELAELTGTTVAMC